MATQLKHTDFSYPTASAQRPNVRVVFSAGAATLAMREATARLPEAVVAATLDELAPKPLRDSLIRRNAIVTRINAGEFPDEDECDEAVSKGIELGKDVLAQPALTPDDAVTKMVALLQVAAEGFELSELDAAHGIAEARRHFGIGYIFHGTLEEMGESAPLPSTEVSFASPNGWHDLYEAYVHASAKRLEFEKGALEKAASLFKAVRSAWPANFEISSDPVAAAAIKAVDYDHIQKGYDDLVSAECDALLELLAFPAQSYGQLSTKLRLFHEHEAHTYTDADAISAALAADSARLDKHDAMKDAALLASFAARRREFVQNQDKPMSPAEDEAYWERVDAAEKPLHDGSATTVEGVLAKLRLAFPHFTSEAYAEHAIGDPASAAFRDGLAMDGMYIRLLWSAIEDLARIGGVNLSERAA